MKIARALLVAVGVLMGLWGLWLIRDFRFDQLRSAGVWLVGGVIVHDGILAPLAVGFGVALARVTPAYARKPVTVGLILWCTVTIAVANVLSGKGGKPDNDTILNRPYVATWLILTVVMFAAIFAHAVISRTRTKAQTATGSES